MRKILWTVIILFLMLPALHAEYGDLTIDRLDKRTGLPNSKIFSIAQDQFGFIWIATENGLERFDGSRFTSYKHDMGDDSSIAGNSLNQLLVDGDGVLWIATKYNGLDRYDPVKEEFTHYQPTGNAGDISGPAITDLCISHNGKMWVSTYYDGLNLLDRATGQFQVWKRKDTKSSVVREDIILSVMEDNEKWLWIGYYSEGLTRYNVETGEVEHFVHDPADAASLPSGKVQDIIQDRIGNVWIGTENGLALYHRSKGCFINFTHDEGNVASLVGNNVMTLCEMKDGKIWIGTENGGISILDLSLPLFDNNAISFKNIRHGDTNRDLSGDSVYEIFQDSFGNIWVGTYGTGINFISVLPASFENLQYVPFSTGNRSLNNKTGWGLCEAPDGRLWIGTDGGGINIYDPSTDTITVVHASPSTIGDDAILCALTDSRGRLWFGTYMGGLTCYDTATGLYTQYKHCPTDSRSLPSNDVRTVYEDHHGHIMIGTMGGLCIFDETADHFQVFTEKDVLIVDNCRAIVEDNDGSYWIGHHGGITHLNADLSFRSHYSHIPNSDEGGLKNDNVYAVYKDTKGRIWFGTDAGICLWCPQDGKFKYYATEEGLADNFVRAITEDDSGLLWMSTNNSISCFDPELEFFINYTYKDGIPLGEFMDNSCLKGSDGMIYFGSSAGVCSFSPHQLMKKAEMPHLNITGFDLFDEAVGPMHDGPLKQNIACSDKITLTHNQNVFTFHFSLPDYSVRNQVVYRYQMKGLDPQWLTDKNLGYVTYKNVPPGTYLFCVQAAMKGPDCHGPEREILVEVLPPIWLRWWMKVIYLVALVSLFYYALVQYTNRMNLKRDLFVEQMRLKEVESLNQEKLQFFTNISHDIKTPLTLIISPINDLMKKDFPEEVLSKLNLVNNNANHLLKMFNRLLAFRKVENGYAELNLSKGNIVGVIMDVCVSYRELRHNENVTFAYKTELEELNVWHDGEKVYSIVDNLISNALKYTKDGEVCVDVHLKEKEEGKFVEIEVKDTGIGLSDEEQKLIFERFYQAKNMTTAMGTGIGLALVDNFVRIHKGYIHLTSEKGKGSCFTVGIPCFLKPDIVTVPEELAEDAPVEGKLMLVVDDNKEICEYVKSCFSSEFRVLTASNGIDAYEIITKDLPDIIISDVMMDGLDGIGLCKKVKGNEATNYIPIILLTAKSSVNDKKEGYDVGADSYVTKPFTSDLLVTRVHNILQSRKKITDYISKNLFGQENADKQQTHTAEVKQNKLIRDLSQIIEENMSEDCLDMEFLAEKLCMSHSSLFRKVKALTGLSINEFIRGIRMQKAKEFLLQGEFSISEVSYMVGINSLRYFRQCFKDTYGMTPTDFLKSHK